MRPSILTQWEPLLVRFFSGRATLATGSSRRVRPAAALLALLSCACGGPTAGPGGGTGGENGGGTPGPAPGQGIDYTFESLDVSSLATQSASWCTPPAFEPSGYSGLDRETLANVLADYMTGWMTPFHETLLGLNEVSLFNSFFEVGMATVLTDCDEITDEDLEALPPSDGQWIDPDVQHDSRQSIIDAVMDAEVLAEGDEVVIVVRQCEGCVDGLAAHPVYITARMTSDGVLTAKVELGEARLWARTLYVTPDAAVAHGPLGELTAWQADVGAASSEDTGVVPDIQGTLTQVIRKDNAGGMSATLGVSSLYFEAQPGTENNVRGQASEGCIGGHFGISAATSEAQVALEIGHFELTVPGTVNCDVSECGEPERTQDWVYSLGGLSLTAEQPGPAELDNLRIGIETRAASTARVGQNEFARGGIGKLGNGGKLGITVDETAGGYLVSFQPALSLGGAMTISAFSDQLRMNLPDWLADEVFDVTFGGDPKASVFVPAREACGASTPAPARRDVRIQQGTLRAERSTGPLIAEAGSCVGKTLSSESLLVSTSDWVDIGYSCP